MEVLILLPSDLTHTQPQVMNKETCTRRYSKRDVGLLEHFKKALVLDEGTPGLAVFNKNPPLGFCDRFLMK